MLREFQSLLIKSAQVQKLIDETHARRASQWSRLMRLKLLRQRLRERILVLVTTPRERPLSAAQPSLVPISTFADQYRRGKSLCLHARRGLTRA